MGEEFTKAELKQNEGRHEFVWAWLSAEGHSRCILLGVRLELVEVGAFDQGEFYVSALLRNKKDGFRWEVVVVYGPANHKNSERFLEELKTKCERTSVSIVLRGFGLIRCQADKNNRNINWMLVNMFNEFIAKHQLHELRRYGSRFTWTNK
jgi:hypothetical protein